MATPGIVRRYNRRHRETYASNFITAVGGTTTEVDIDLPPGWYDPIIMYGLQTFTAGTAPTLKIEQYVSAGTTTRDLGLGHYNETTPTFINGLPMTDERRGLYLYVSPREFGATAAQFDPIYLPHGVKVIYTKNDATAINLTFSARRIG